MFLAGHENWTGNLRTQPYFCAWRRRATVVLAAALAGILLPALPMYSQGRIERRREALAVRRMRVRQALRRAVARRAGFYERLRDLPPKEQERILRNDKRFQSLPPERQAKIRENLQRWNQLSPQQKWQIRHRERVFSQLTPEQRQNVREMSGQWLDLRPEERRQVRLALRQMRGMTPAERQKFLNSPQFRKRFSPRGQGILRGLDRLFPGGDGALDQ
jgi:Protein of unknown function (DUF3106)